MASVATRIPDSVAHLDLATVAEVLVKHGANVRNAAAELGVPTSDLRQLTLVNQALINAAYEAEELRLDRAEAAVDEALKSDDSRRKDAAAYFILRNSSRAKRRGWITSSSASVDVNVQANRNVNYTFRWRTSEDDERDTKAAEAERLLNEGKPVVSIGWGGDGKTIEHEAGRQPSGKD
jgi:ribosomal protein S7